MERRRVVVRGRLEDVPEGVLNLEIWKKYRRAWLDYYNSDEKRKYIFESGKTIKLPYPDLEGYCKRNEISIRELRLAQKKANSCRKEQATITAMQKLAYVPEGSKLRSAKPYALLLKENETLMLELFGRFFNPRQVHKKFAENNVKISYEAVLTFFHQNKEKIRELRNKAQENLDDLSVGVKRSRLEILDFLLGDLRELYGKQTNSQKLFYSKEIRGIVEQARKEVEGDELKLTVNGRIDVNATIEVAMNSSSLLRDFTIVQMVMSRVALRTGTPYMKIVTRLANSFYSKFNGFRKNDNLEETPIYPSSFNYDIFEMKPIVDELYRVEDATYTTVEEELPLEVQETREVDKDKLRELLGIRVEEVDRNKRKLL